MASSIFGSGLSGLHAAKMGLATTEHNIANMNTPGFSRQETVQVPRMAQYTGGGYIGKGADVTTVKRVYSEFIGKQLLQEETVAAQLETYHGQIKQIDNMLADSSAGMAPVIQEFFSAVHNVSNAPESQPARQALINNAGSLASRFQSVNQRLIDLNTTVNGEISDSVGNINSYAKQISALNNTITVAAAANGRPPNDLMDQRDHLITQLNKEIKATVVKQSDGSYNVFIGNGQSLVVGAQAFTLKPELSATDPSKMVVAYVNADGITTSINQSSLTGGNLSGLLEFREKSLTNTQNMLGRLAMGIAGTFNEQHKLGQDLNGDLGVDFFNRPTPQVIANRYNKGDASVAVDIVMSEDYTALTGSDYELKYNGGTSYTLTRLSDHKIFNFPDCLPEEPVDGLTLSMTGDAVAGDKFTIRPTINGARDLVAIINDPAKIAAAIPVRSMAMIENIGTGKVSEAKVNTQPDAEFDPEHPDTDINLREPVSIVFNDPPTSYKVLGVNFPDEEMIQETEDGPCEPPDIPYIPGEDISYHGWTIKITGSPAPGDVFKVESNINATADGRNSLSLAALQTARTMAGGTTSYQGAYGQIVSDIGNKTRELEVTSTAQANMVAQSVQTQQTLSGVNLDEEAANLLRYQRAYQASGKALQIADSMFDTILGLGR